MRWLAVVLLLVPAAASALVPGDFSLLGHAASPVALPPSGLGLLAQAPGAPAAAPASSVADAPEAPVAQPNHLLGALVAVTSVIADVLGAGTSVLVQTFGIDDLVGFRHGFLLPKETPTCCQEHGLGGRDYSSEIYTGDFKLAGLARRLGWRIGPLKYLNLSFTYGTKGYPNGTIETRERQVGIEVGLDVQEIPDGIGARRDNIRFPFTAGGFPYDLNQKKWHGLDSGNSFGF